MTEMAQITQVRLRRRGSVPPPEIEEEEKFPRPRWRPWRVPFALLLVLGVGVLWWHGWSLQRVHRTIMDAYLVALTRVEVYNIAEQVRLHHLAEEQYPADFKTFLATFQRTRNGQPPWMDLWGRAYILDILPGEEFEVRSAGPDRRYYTRDDRVERGSVLPKAVR